MTQSTPSHYDGLGTIEKQESLIEMLIERGMDAARAFDAATAVKYIDRAGRKDGESDEKDLGKAADYLFRAVFGRWPWDSIEIEQTSENITISEFGKDSISDIVKGWTQR